MTSRINDLYPVGQRLIRAMDGSPHALGLGDSAKPDPAEDRWEELLDMAVTNGVTAYVHAWLVKIDPLGATYRDVQERLTARARANTLRTLALRGELLRVLDEFHNAGIRVMPLKGPVLADLHYRRPELREFGDIDLLVEEVDLHRAWQMLLGLGYHSPYENHTLDERYHVVFKHVATNEVVELHWRIAGPQYGSFFRGEFLWARASRRPYRNGREVWQPSPEATLLYLSIHAYKHDWERLQWLADIPEVLRRPGVDWDLLEALARENGAYRLLRSTLQLAWDVFPDSPRPPEKHALTVPGLNERMIARVRRLILRRPLDRERGADFLMLRVANADSWKVRFGLLMSRARTSDRDLDVVSGRPWFKSLAWLIRPLRLLARAVSGASRSGKRKAPRWKS